MNKRTVAELRTHGVVRLLGVRLARRARFFVEVLDGWPTACLKITRRNGENEDNLRYSH